YCCSISPIQQRSNRQRMHRPRRGDQGKAFRRHQGSEIRRPPFLQTEQSHPPIRHNLDVGAQRPRSARQGFDVSATTTGRTYHEERGAAAPRRREIGARFYPEPLSSLLYSSPWMTFPDVIVKPLSLFIMHSP